MSSIGLVAIQSATNLNIFLRIDGADVNKHNGGGNGTVNCQFYNYEQKKDLPVAIRGNYEVFDLIPLAGPRGRYAIRSLNFPNAFLRIDGSNVHLSKNGSGLVNCQYYSSGDYPTDNSEDYEHLIITKAVLETRSNPARYSILSGRFHVYLRMDGSKMTQGANSGSGTVNCQVPTDQPTLENLELFNIIYLTPPSAVET